MLPPAVASAAGDAVLHPTRSVEREVPTQQRALTTRSQILSAAVASFSRGGFDATAVAEICSLAGISKGAFYHHFPSKNSLYFELLQEWLLKIDTELRRHAEEAESVPAALHAMTEVFGDIFDRSRSELAVFLEFLARASRDRTFRNIAAEPYRRYEGFFSALIEKGIKQGSVQKCDPGRTARILVSLAVGLVMQGMLDPDVAGWRSTAEETIREFIRRFIEKTPVQ